MIMEAARQLADPTRRIAGYRFKDVTIQKALVVPSTGGTETQVYLRPSREATNGFLVWNECRICGYENGEWSDHCQGAVAVEYETQKVDLNHSQEIEETYRRYTKDFDNATESCTKCVGSKHLYKQLNNLGLIYGPTFQTLQSIYSNNAGEAIAMSNMGKWVPETSPGHIRSPHVIHPAALDAILQLIIPALTKGANGPFPIMVPTQIRNLWISNIGNMQLLQNQDTSAGNVIMKLYNKAKYKGFRNAASSFFGFDATSGKPCIIGDFQTTFVRNNVVASSSGTKWKQLCYNVDWKPDTALLSDEQIGLYCLAENTTQIFSEEAMLEDKILVCHLALVNLIKSHLDQTLDEDKPYLRKYVEWAAHYMSALDISTTATSGWARLADEKERLKELHHRVEIKDAEGKLIVRIAKNLLSVLRGEVDALDLLFHDDLMDQYYGYIQRTNFAFRKICRYIDALAHKSPDIKILEIGAGTGGATEDILQTLVHRQAGGSDASRFSEYAFTDISPSFFEEARSKFKPHVDRMVFAALDIQQDPVKQGFKAEEYDLIVAANVSSP
jgi:SAM-dependent methyltransferase